MKKQKINVFLPCRQGSERIPKKNIKKFGDFEYGLLQNKIEQLLKVQLVEKIYVSTDDQIIIDYLVSLKNEKIIIHKRDDNLCNSETSTDELVKHAGELLPEGIILWTHVTSPFVNACVYDNMIESYLSSIKKSYDSLMSVTPIHGFIWNKGRPINYDRNIEKWPRTQSLEPLYDVNSAAFIADRKVYLNVQDRIGDKPYLFKLDKILSTDIDWEEDFLIAESLLKSNDGLC